ncbi:MAG: hypothetical protein NW206_12515 [Hyphomonadaceae bacterium]|nr:hypothetical protein [Hyphomonadaceae bacterium]
MATVVIIHAAEDALPARALADKLRGANLNPVIEVPPGEDLRTAISGAPVTMALWSPRSSTQQALIDETKFARTRSKVVHARMQNTPTPSAFSGDPSIDLTGWRGEDDFPAWRELAMAVTQIAGVPLPPPPPPKGPASFFSPGRPADAAAPPRPAPAAQRAPQQARPPAPQPPRPAASAPPPRSAPAAGADDGSKKGFPLVPVIIAAVLLVGGVGGYFVWTNMQGSQTAAAWDDVPRNDARALRDFIADNPGSRREEAEQALRDLEEQSFDAAQEEDTIEAFETFLNEFPESDHAIAARGRIAELRSMPPVEDTTLDPLGDTTTLADPDLLPPTTEPLPETSGEGPAALTPPEPDPSQGPAELTPPPG